MRKFLFLFLPISLSAQVFETDTVQPRILTIDQDSLHVDLSFEPKKGLVHGNVQIWCKPQPEMDSIWLDAQPGITVMNGPFFNGDSARWERKQKGIVIWPEEEWTEGRIEINYSARPFKGVYFNGWNDPEERARRQIFTQGQGIDHRHWLPHQDAQNDKLKTSMTLFFEEGYDVLANGELIEKREADGGHYWTYALNHPHSSYLMAFVVGKYDEIQTGESPFRAVYIYHDHLQDTATTYYANEEIWDYLIDRIDYPYVWSTYRQVPVANFPHGGMENTTLTIYTENFISNEINFRERNYVYVNAHELAHHWFGDLVTVPSSHDFWLHEGFATYYQMEAERDVFGREYYTERWLEALRLANEANLQDQFPLQHSKAGTSRFYQLGALVLRALETEIGTYAFDEGVKAYLEEYAFGLVTTADFQASMETACSCDLDPFFEGYVEHPFSLRGQLEVKELENGRVQVRARVQNELGDLLPLRNVQLRTWVAVDDESPQLTTISLTDGDWWELDFDQLAFVEIDPDHRYPIQWDVDMDGDRSMNAVAFGSYATQHINVRHFFNAPGFSTDALDIVLSRIQVDHQTNALLDSLVIHAPQEFQTLILERWMDQGQLPPAAQSIADHWDFESLSRSVQNRFIEYLVSPKASATLTDQEVFYLTMFVISSNPRKVLSALDALEGRTGGMNRGIEINRAYLTVLVKGPDAPDGLPLLMDYASESYSNDVRMSAWTMLDMIGYTDKDLRHMQYLALTSRHRHLRNAAKRYCQGYLEKFNREEEIAQIEFALRNAEVDDIERVERILDIKLDIEPPRLEQ